MIEGAYKKQIGGVKQGVVTGYIIVPEGEDRDGFVLDCLRKEKVSVLIEGGGGISHGCYITKSALRDIYFPPEGTIIGCGVVMFADKDSGKFVVIGVINKDSELQLLREQVISFRRTKDGNFALFTMNGGGQISIDVFGESSEPRIDISISGGKRGSLNLNINGDANVYTNGSVNIKTISGDVNIDSEGDVNFKTTKFNIGDHSQPMVLGSTLQDNLTKTNEVVESILKSLNQWQPVPEDGGAALKSLISSNLAGKGVGDFSEINSKQSYLE